MTVQRHSFTPHSVLQPQNSHGRYARPSCSRDSKDPLGFGSLSLSWRVQRHSEHRLPVGSLFCSGNLRTCGRVVGCKFLTVLHGNHPLSNFLEQIQTVGNVEFFPLRDFYGSMWFCTCFTVYTGVEVASSLCWSPGASSKGVGKELHFSLTGLDEYPARC